MNNDQTPSPSLVHEAAPDSGGAAHSTVGASVVPPASASLAVTVKEQSDTDVYATVEALGWMQYSIAANRDENGQDWYIRVTHPDGGRLYDGPWHYSATKSADEVIAEAIHGACLRKCPAGMQPLVQWGPIFDALDGFPNDMRDDDYCELRRLIVAEHERTLTAIDGLPPGSEA
jgi:hypothetical protein